MAKNRRKRLELYLFHVTLFVLNINLRRKKTKRSHASVEVRFHNQRPPPLERQFPYLITSRREAEGDVSYLTPVLHHFPRLTSAPPPPSTERVSESDLLPQSILVVIEVNAAAATPDS